MSGNTVSIVFCTTCGYFDKAVNVVRLILLRYPKGTVESFTLIPGSNGAFEIALNGQLVYSKLATNRFPSEQEVIEKATSIIGNPF